MVWEAGGGPQGFAREKLSAAFAYALETARGDVANSLLYATVGITALRLAAVAEP